MCIPETMKQLQVERGGEGTVLRVPVPAPGPGEVLVRVDAVNTCPQWDLHLRHDEPMFVGHQFHYPYTPGQPGHEASGVLAAVGPGVAGLAVGDRVSVWRDAGHHVPGCYAQFALREAEHVIRVPARLPAEATASVELAMCVAATVTRLRDMVGLAGRRVGVVGLGPAGLVAAQMARAEGAASVTGFETAPVRRRYADGVGVLDGAALDPGADTGEPALEVIVDCVGARASVEWALDRAALAVGLFGVQRTDYTFGPRHYTRTLIGYAGHSREAAEYAVGQVEAGRLDLGLLVTHRLPLERYAEGIALLERQEAVKVCFTPWE